MGKVTQPGFLSGPQGAPAWDSEHVGSDPGPVPTSRMKPDEAHLQKVVYISQNSSTEHRVGGEGRGLPEQGAPPPPALLRPGGASKASLSK